MSPSVDTAANAAARKGRNYHTKCTGDALRTVDAHSGEPRDDEGGDGLTLFGANFCPFVQRTWIALELLGQSRGGTKSEPIPYKYFEVDPYKKPQELLDVNPKGLVPALRIGSEGKCLGESTVILDYLADRYADSKTKAPLLPGDAYQRAQQRLASDRVNRTLIPTFYRYLQAQEPEKQVEAGHEFVEELRAFEKGMQSEKTGVFWDGTEYLGWVDAMIAPWLLRAHLVLRYYRGLDIESAFPDENGRLRRYLQALFGHPVFRATTSDDELYLDSYARYAENRPNTSQVANAINSGRGLP